MSDSDTDGIVDPQDECPFHPEVYNDWDDTDGCPDSAVIVDYVSAEARRAAAFLRQVVYCPPDEVSPSPQGIAAIEEWIPQLRARLVDMTVIIEGHTAAGCSPAECLDLGRRRAEAVRALFVTGGVSPMSIEVRSRGAEQPVSSNDDRWTQAANHRVEIQVVTRSPP